jgi:GTP-binding protein YchF
MILSCGLVGLPNVGKSTLFQILTDSFDVVAANYPFSTIEPNVAKVPLLDDRLSNLFHLVKAEKIVPELIEFVDIAGLVEGASHNKGMGNAFLQHIREVDLVVHVTRCFHDPDIIHVMDRTEPDPVADFLIIETELIMADLMWLDKQKDTWSKKVAKNILTQEEANLLKKAYDFLSTSEAQSLRNYSWNPSEKQFLLKQGLLSMKPIIIVGNISDQEIKNPQKNVFYKKLLDYTAPFHIPTVAIAPLLEKDIKTMASSAEELNELFIEMGNGQSSLMGLAQLCHQCLGYITYFTAGEKEVRAWSIVQGTLAPQAAGRIHSDLEKGFISAKRLGYEEFLANKGWDGTVVRPTHYKADSLVEDGDVLLFLTSSHTKSK